MAEVIKVNNWINNQEVPAEKYLDVYDPGKFDEVVGQVAQGDAKTLDQAAKAGAAAQPAWAALSVAERKKYVEGLLKITQDSMADLVELLVRESGEEKRTAELDFGIAMGSFQYYTSVIEKYMESEVLEDETSRTRIDKVPKGICAGIVPWNMPICLTMSKLPLALLTGNAMIIKPPSDTPLALTLLLQRYAKALPDGILNIVNGSGGVLGNAITEHPLIRKVGFTGSTAAGRSVYEGCAKNLKTATLELGGNDASIVLDDCDINEVVPNMLHGIFDRSGQICFANKRIYVPNQMLDAFFDKLCEAVDELKTGYGLDPDTYYGPVMNKKQYDHINNLIEDAKKTGSVVRTLGGKSTPELWDRGYYVLPHVIKANSNDIAIVQQEQFGPAIPVIGYDSEQQAVDWANGTSFGLCSSVWSKDPERAIKVAGGVRAGQTFINAHSMFALTFGVPFGGFKESGIGREFTGELSLDAYVDYHAVRLIK